MSTLRRQRLVLLGLLLFFIILTAAILWEVLEVVFFAVTIAYVLYPVRKRLVNRGISVRIASAISTLIAFTVVIFLLAPIVWTLFRRRHDLISIFMALPAELEFEFFGYVVDIDVEAIVVATNIFLRNIAISLAADAFVIILQLFLFIFLLYGILLQPDAVGRAAFEIVPSAYHDVIKRLNKRVTSTLYALYVVQAATAVITFPFALIIFSILGYESVFVLSVVAAILQFIPIVGPSFLAAGLAGHDLMMGMQSRAVAIIILGPIVLGLLPDILVRPKMASRQAKLPASLYFVGFVGGVLTVGVIGIIAGPLVVALLVEVVKLLSENQQNNAVISR